MAARKPRFTLFPETQANGKTGKTTWQVLDSNGVMVHKDKVDMDELRQRRAFARGTAPIIDKTIDETLELVNAEWLRLSNEYRQQKEKAATGSAEAVPLETTTILDTAPPTIRRPLCLIDGRAYAATWLQLQRTISRAIDPATSQPITYNPPLVKTEEALVIVEGDGTLYTNAIMSNARPLAELGIDVKLSSASPGQGWSGAGVKRFRDGARPDPVDVFNRIAEVVDRFIDFDRSLATQTEMCELTACYILGTYFLDAFNVVGYLWPNGERGTGKTTYLQVVVQQAYLGQLIMAGGSFAALRDLADHGATLAFDDAEAVMDTRRSDPDKSALLLAGNRRGVTVPLKELDADGKRWITRHVNAFCPRLFSAIRSPADALGSRTIIIPLVRSGDAIRAKSNPMDPEDWPHDRGRLIDDLWALGLAHLPELSAHDRQAAAEVTELAGRNLDPWRMILAVAHWLQNRGGAGNLFRRMRALAVAYHHQERGDFEETDKTRILFRALLRFPADEAGQVEFAAGKVSEAMNRIAEDEELWKGDKAFTTASSVGWLLKRQRFKRPREKDSKERKWKASREEIVKAANAYGVKEEDETPESVETPFN